MTDSLSRLNPLDPVWLSVVIARARPRAYFTPSFNAPLFTRVPLVMTVHDLNYLYVTDNSTLLRRTYYRTVVRSGCRRATKVLTVSEFSRAQIIAWSGVLPERVVNVGNGVSDVFVPTGEAHEPGFPYLLYVGLRGAHKNLPRLIRAFGRARVDPRTRLLLTGFPDSELLRIAVDGRCANRLQFAGSLDDGELARLYRGAVALVMPSTFEGYGLPAMEAMACGTPALIAHVGGMLEACGNAALCVDPLDIDSITTGIERIANDHDLREQLRQRGIARSVHTRWTQTAARVAAVLAEIP